MVQRMEAKQPDEDRYVELAKKYKAENYDEDIPPWVDEIPHEVWISISQNERQRLMKGSETIEDKNKPREKTHFVKKAETRKNKKKQYFKKDGKRRPKKKDPLKNEIEKGLDNWEREQ